jgi:hypothetical protein
MTTKFKVVDLPPETPDQAAGCPAADNQRSGKTWRDGLITARELQTKQFKPVRIVVPGLIPEGVTIIAGKPGIVLRAKRNPP